MISLFDFVCAGARGIVQTFFRIFRLSTLRPVFSAQANDLFPECGFRQDADKVLHGGGPVQDLHLFPLLLGILIQECKFRKSKTTLD